MSVLSTVLKAVERDAKDTFLALKVLSTEEKREICMIRINVITANGRIKLRM